MHEHEKYYDVENLVDEVFKSEPGFSLSDGFADKLAEKVSRKFAWIQYSVWVEYFFKLFDCLKRIAGP